MSRRSSKWWRMTVKVGKLVMVGALCVLLVPPLRDMVLFPVLPGAWRLHSSVRLARMLMDTQHFPIDSPLSHGQHAHPVPSLEVNLSDVNLFLEKTEPYPEFHQQRKRLSELAKNDTQAAEELVLINSFKPIMTRQERAQLWFTFDVFLRACRQHRLTFFIAEGSLLGSYRHNGIIPWDDDIDIAVNASQWKDIRRVLDNIPGFTLYAPSDSQWKFYLSSLPPFHDKPFKWPNLDIFFFSERDSYVWGLTWGLKGGLMVHVKHLLPLSTVTWQRWQLPAPACVEKMMMSGYDLSSCVTPTYVHKTNEEVFGFQTEAILCSRLYKYFPFVFRHKDSRTGQVVESLKVGDRVVHNNKMAASPQCSD